MINHHIPKTILSRVQFTKVFKTFNILNVYGKKIYNRIFEIYDEKSNANKYYS